MGLIDAFNDAGYHQVFDIKFEIDKKTTVPENERSAGSTNQHFKREPRESLSHEALNTLEHCEKGVKSEKLSASLKKLHDTLDNLKKPNG